MSSGDGARLLVVKSYFGLDNIPQQTTLNRYENLA